MKESRDPAIKLFGKEIPLPENCGIPAITGDHKRGGDISGVVAREDSKLADGHRNQQQSTTPCLAEKKLSRVEFEEAENKQTEAEKDPMPAKPTESKGQSKIHPLMIEESTNTETLPEPEDSHKTLPMTEETESAKPSNENDQSDSTNNSQQQPLKKPDKILPCPRCNSMDTKFCYYNNYSINQPRHFCKACQRYWTAGGTMRNVPVGAGRRKNKNSASHCRHITISEALQVVQIDIPNGAHHPAAFKPNGTVLSFGPEAPLCESMASVLNLAERKAPNGIRNGFYKTEQGMPIASAGGENGDDCSSGSSITTSSSLEEGGRNGYHQEPMSCNLNGFHSQIPFLPGAPWPYPWNSPVPIPAFCPNGFPMPIIPAPLWNCGVPGAWALPWLSPPSPTAIQRPPNSAPSSPNLGKHSRDGDLLKPSSNSEGKEHPDQKNLEGSIVIPKTLRIVDPDQAARSSIWVTLGIKNDSINKGGLFKGFQPKDGEKRRVVETSSALQANPAALSRSLSFQETA